MSTAPTGCWLPFTGESDGACEEKHICMFKNMEVTFEKTPLKAIYNLEDS